MSTLLLLLACTGSQAPIEEAAVEAPVAEAPAAEESTAAEAPAAEEAVSRPAVEPLVISSEAGEIKITPVYHGTAHVELGGRSIWIDPWSKADLSRLPKADLLLITDIHFDHLDPAAIGQVVKEDTQVVAPRAVAEAEGAPQVQHVMDNGASIEIDGLTITAVPMYNTVRGPEEGGVFHEKGRGNGYLLTFGGTTIYFSGDTECTPEMKALSDVDQAFITMNLPYTMPPDEAAECVKAFKPAAVTPYHYAGSDLSVFVNALSGVPGVTVTKSEFYPGGMPW